MTKEEILNNFREETGAKYDINYWNAALKAMEAYASQQKGCSRWVKASERLPEKEVFAKLDGKIGLLKPNGDYSILFNCGSEGWRYDFTDPTTKYFEWLDESSPCSCDQLREGIFGLKKEIEQKIDGLNKHDITGHIYYHAFQKMIDEHLSAALQTKAQ